MIEEVKIKQCSDGRIKKEYLLPGSIDREQLHALKNAGDLFIMDYLAEPVYTIVQGTLYNVRGMIGRKKIEIWYSPDELESSEQIILSFFEAVYRDNESNL